LWYDSIAASSDCRISSDYTIVGTATKSPLLQGYRAISDVIPGQLQFSPAKILLE